MSLKFLFVPVSTPKGIGEYMRSLSLADEIQRNYPEAKICFVLSKEAPYHEHCPFEVKLTPHSPTFHTKLVNQYIDDFKPDVALFDASGRVAQLSHCKKLGIKTVFICPRIRKLSKGLKFSRLRHTDRIWIAQPPFATKPLTLWSKLKLRLLSKPHPTIIGPVFARPNEEIAQNLRERYGLENKRYIVVSSGSGGHYINNKRVTDIFANAALKIAKACDLSVVMVYGHNSKTPHKNVDDIIEIPHLEPEEFNSLLCHAKAALLAGGSSLLQSISYKLRVVAAPITEEQHARVSLCASLGLIVESNMCEDIMAEKMLSLVNNKQAPLPITIENGLDEAILELSNLLKD